MAHLSVAIIGPFQATVNTQVVSSFQSNKVRALLAFLAAETERLHSRESLAGLLWPDYPNPSALTYLRNALSNLRQTIGDAQAKPPYLVISRGTIQINPASSCWIDLRAFDDFTARTETPQSQINSLQSAIALYRGPFLDGFSCDSSAFEEWALTRRERLNRQLREALSRLAGAYAQCGEFDQSIQTAQRLLELEPWDEAAHRLAMQGLARSGQRSAALAQYETCRRILRQELGVEPAAETQAMLEIIRGGGLAPAAGSTILTEKPLPLIRPRLPAPLTSFIGRQGELAEIQRLLGHPDPETKARLLTLLGAGGCGKTRLAIATAHSLADADCFAQGVWWVDLSPISDPGLVLSTVAAAFGLAESESGSTPLLQLLLNFLREKELLLVLDNSEHLIASTAQLAEKLLEECPGLQILVTSREPLGVPGEKLWRVPSLSLPDPLVDQPFDPDAIRQFDAVHLFEERARAALSEWKLDGNTAGVVEICTRLDGIPLAIELAAARLRMMTVEQIATRLDDTFHLLTGGSRTSLPRHQTLRACIDWSYNLLSPAEGALLRQLSVFQGGWTLEAVEAICKTNPSAGILPEDVLELFTQLVDRSLVVGQIKGRSMRYRLLDTIRQYAYEKLAEVGEEQAACRRHLAYFLDLAVRAEARLRGPHQVEWHELVKAELDNFRAALTWALKVDPLAELRIASALYWFWRMQAGWQFEGLHWLERGLAADTARSGPASCTGDPDRALIRGWALNVAAWHQANLLFHSFGWTVYRTESERQAAHTRKNMYSEEALALFRGLGKPGRRGLAFVYRLKGRWDSDPQRGKTLMDESLAIFREEGDKFYTAESLTYLGLWAERVKDFDQARALYQQELTLRKEIGDLEGLGWAHLQLGKLEFSINRFRIAKTHLEQALAFYQGIGISKEFIWATTWILSDLAIAQSDLNGALKYSEMMLATARKSGEDGNYAYGLQVKGCLLIQGDQLQAATLLNEALRLFRRTGDKEGMAWNLEGQTSLAITLLQFERAARLLGASLHWFEAEKMLLNQIDLTRQENLRNIIQAALEEPAFAKAWAESNSMTLEQAVAYALEENE